VIKIKQLCNNKKCDKKHWLRSKSSPLV